MIEYFRTVQLRRTGFDSGRGHSRILACGNRAGRRHLSAGFLGVLPFPPPFHSGIAPYSPHFTLVGSYDLDLLAGKPSSEPRFSSYKDRGSSVNCGKNLVSVRVKASVSGLRTTSANNSDDIPERRKGKRRTKPKNYKRNVIKRAIVMGKQYENHAGKVVPAKRIGNAYNQLYVFSNFYKDYSLKDKQDIYLQGLIDVVDVKRRPPRDDSGKEVRSALDGYGLYKLKGKSPVDKWGKHTTFMSPPDTKIKVQDHIESFPVKESHYTGKPVKYLSADLNVLQQRRSLAFKKSNDGTYLCGTSNNQLQNGLPALWNSNSRLSKRDSGCVELSRSRRAVREVREMTNGSKICDCEYQAVKSEAGRLDYRTNLITELICCHFNDDIVKIFDTRTLLETAEQDFQIRFTTASRRLSIPVKAGFACHSPGLDRQALHNSRRRLGYLSRASHSGTAQPRGCTVFIRLYPEDVENLHRMLSCVTSGERGCADWLQGFFTKQRKRYGDITTARPVSVAGSSSASMQK
ncbi:hypothetical protein PR048_030327 [Dryococelus australis]|uniref:Uncharacterized protein n=1 Tax=Dryococelus australis TaxID=614101 RepID=A0ABQ9G9G2_9NEOP|nr:hypothetical protein PR048_030327 [Dryococelus australis]